jgi:hypothetical protein
MNHDIDEYRRRHLAFWNLKAVEQPLVGFTIGVGVNAWSYWQYNKATVKLLNRRSIVADDLNPADFVDDQLKYLELCDQIDDDICRTAMPLASIPWMEAILGCPVLSTEAGFKSAEILDYISSLKPLPFDPDNPWVKKYLEFVEVYGEAFGSHYPVSQSVLRGPSDLACALLGAENATMALVMDSSDMHRLLEYVTGQLEKFLRLQLKHLPKFQDGYVIGQYDIWAPEPCIRFQEDFTVLYSPRYYVEFLMSLDERLAGISPYNLIHLHASSLFLIDHFLEVSGIRAFQVTKDPGGTFLSEMIPALQKIQQAGKPLIVKGEFDDADIELMKRNLSLHGLCIQPVVNGISQAETLLPALRNWA